MDRRRPHRAYPQPASLEEASAMSVNSIDLALITPFHPRPGTYGSAIAHLYPSPYMCPDWLVYSRGIWDNMWRRWLIKTEKQLTSDMIALFTALRAEERLMGGRIGFSRVPDFMVESDLSSYHDEQSVALLETDIVRAVRTWQTTQFGDSISPFSLPMQGISLDPQPTLLEQLSRAPSPYGASVRPLLDAIVCPALAIVATNENMRNGFTDDDPESSRPNKKLRHSDLEPIVTSLPGPSTGCLMTAYTGNGPLSLPPLPLTGTKRKRQDSLPAAVSSSIAYIHASETRGQGMEAVAERALSTAILQVLSAFQACGTFLASASCYTRWLRILALRKDHVLVETVNFEDAFQTFSFADLLQQGDLCERFAWDLAMFEEEDEPDMETIEQVWLGLYAAFRIAAEWPLEGPIPRIPPVAPQHRRWLKILDMTESHSDAEGEPDDGQGVDIRLQVDVAFSRPFASPATSSLSTTALHGHSGAEAILAGGSPGESHEWNKFFFSHPDLVALFTRLDIKVTFVTPSFVDQLIIERIPGYIPHTNGYDESV